MNVLVCVDDHMGMVFNKRRQSRDGAILQKIQELAGENKIWIHEFSKNLFGEEIEVTVDNEFLEWRILFCRAFTLSGIYGTFRTSLSLSLE